MYRYLQVYAYASNGCTVRRCDVRGILGGIFMWNRYILI